MGPIKQFSHLRINNAVDSSAFAIKFMVEAHFPKDNFVATMDMLKSAISSAETANRLLTDSAAFDALGD